MSQIPNFELNISQIINHINCLYNEQYRILGMYETNQQQLNQLYILLDELRHNSNIHNNVVEPTIEPYVPPAPPLPENPQPPSLPQPTTQRQQRNESNSYLNANFTYPRNNNNFRNNYYSYTTRFYIPTRELSDLSGNFLDPVDIRPSDQELNRSLITCPFSQIDNPLNSACPINLEHFQPEQIVSRIIQCGHIFHTPSIQEWFRNHVRCPICRFDIRNTNMNTNTIQNNENEEYDNEDDNENESSIPSLIPSRVNDFVNTIENNINNNTYQNENNNRNYNENYQRNNNQRQNNTSYQTQSNNNENNQSNNRTNQRENNRTRSHPSINNDALFYLMYELLYPSDPSHNDLSNNLIYYRYSRL